MVTKHAELQCTNMATNTSNNSTVPIVINMPRMDALTTIPIDNILKAARGMFQSDMDYKAFIQINI